MTPTGLKPWQKKIEPILALVPPKTVKQLRSFIGMINFYRDMWRHRAHILTPLTAMTKISNKEFTLHWNPECDKAFAAVKAMICQEVLLTYPNPDLPYDIETDASDKQLGAAIYQNSKPIAFFSRKLTSAQTRYPTIDKECCVHDAGTEFLGAHFQSTLAAFGIGCVPCTPKNPQSNVICERMHSTVGGILP
jgi:hypothetical protein